MSLISCSKGLITVNGLDFKSLSGGSTSTSKKPNLAYSSSNATAYFNDPFSLMPSTLEDKGHAITNCTATPALSNGLSINTTTCEISGTPSATMVQTDYQIVATNSQGDSDAVALEITISPSTPELTYSGGSTTFYQGGPVSITPTTLNENGATITDCKVKPGSANEGIFPAEFSINNTTCEITATASSLIASTVFTIIATNSAGDSSDATIEFSIVTCDNLVPGGSPTFFSGTGVPGDPFTICSVGQLVALSGDSGLWGDDYKLIADIDMTSIPNHVPIGNGTTQFTGSFDGDNHTISNLTVNYNANYNGLFGYTSSTSTVKNIIFESATITGRDYSSVVIGRAEGSIDTVQVKNSTVNESAASTYNWFGCIAGLLTGASAIVDNSSADNCDFTMDAFKRNVGGLVGAMTNSATLQNSFNINSEIEGGRNVGGVVGAASTSCNIRNSYGKDLIVDSKETSSVSYVGGIVGYMAQDSSVEKSYTDGVTVTGIEDFVGGIAGYVVNGSTVKQVYSINGSVTGTLSQYVGGIAGRSVTGAYEVSDCYSNLTVTGFTRVGGIVGDGGNTEHCYFYGSATDTNDGSLDGGISPSNCDPYSLYSTDLCPNCDNSCHGVTTAQMNSWRPYYNLGFDFSGSGPWRKRIGGGYPVFSWQTDLAEDVTAPANFTSGTGDTDLDPFIITTKEEFDKLALDDTLCTKHFKLGADIDFENSPVAINCPAATPFSGSFDGDGHTISNASIISYRDVGFFGVINGASFLKNVHFDNISIRASSDGGIVSGEANTTNFQNIRITNSSVSGAQGSSYTTLGGLSGKTQALTIYRVLIQNSDIGNTLTSSSGALAGGAYDGTNIYEVASVGNTVNAFQNGGGIVGYMADVLIQDSYSTSTVNASNMGAGGIVGYTVDPDARVYQTYYAGVANDDNTGAQDGGTLGRGDIDIGYDKGNFWNSEVCTNCSNIQGRGQTSVNMQDWPLYVGGGFDFSGVWEMPTSGSYPQLKWLDGTGSAPVAEFGGGSGDSAGDPYLISNFKHFYSIYLDNSHLNKHYRLMTDLNFVNWDLPMIGSLTSPFTASFDGNSHIISNGELLYPLTNDIGLFGKVSSTGLIKDLTVSNFNIIGDERLGILAGTVEGGLENITINGGHIDSINDSAYPYGFGCVAYKLDGASAYIEDTTSSCTHNSFLDTGYRGVGGIVAYIDNGARVERTSYSTGSTYTVSGGFGGIAYQATNNSIINESSGENFNVTCSSSAASGIGGIVYALKSGSSLTKSYTDSITITSTDKSGGIVGVATDSGTTIEQVYSTNSTVNSTGQGTGGIIGSKAHTSVVVKKCYSNNTVNGEEWIGGISGSGSNHEECYFYGAVTDTDDAGPVGGIVGNGSAAKSIFHSTNCPNCPGSSSNGIASNTTDMNDWSTYVNLGWDFTPTTGVWYMPSGGGYPIFQWQSGGVNIPDFSSVSFDGGDGIAPASAWQISNVNQLKKIALDTQYLDDHFKLSSDIDFSNSGHLVIGDNSNKFSGTFNGNGKTISNINIVKDGYAGFFGSIDTTAEIFDLTIKDATLNSNDTRNGLIAGQSLGHIHDIKISNSSLNSSNSTSGCVVGHMFSASSIIRDAHVNCTIDAHYQTGGIAGSSSNGTIEQSFVYNSSITGEGQTGGLIGYATNSVHNVNHNTVVNSSITGENAGSQSGGLVGYLCGGNFQHLSAINLTVEGGHSAGGVFGESCGSNTGTTMNNIVVSAQMTDNNDGLDDGGVFGTSDSTSFSDVIWDSDICTNCSLPDGTAETTANMSTNASTNVTYPVGNWPAADWYVIDGQYPTLKYFVDNYPEPILLQNSGLSTTIGSTSVVIDEQHLSIEDFNHIDGDVFIEIVSEPTRGVLRINAGAPLNNTSSFTLWELLDGRLTYDHTAGDGVDDSFTFKIFDNNSDEAVDASTASPATFTITID
jgi:hypothetical protein